MPCRIIVWGEIPKALRQNGHTLIRWNIKTKELNGQQPQLKEAYGYNYSNLIQYDYSSFQTTLEVLNKPENEFHFEIAFDDVVAFQ